MKTITVKTNINAPISEVWEFFTKPQHITKWNQATDEWHSPHAENDLQRNGKFSYRMEEREGSNGFDFSGKYSDIKNLEKINYTLDDGRKVETEFRVGNDGQSTVIQRFEPDPNHSEDLQKKGWQLILDNFKKYVEMNAVKNDEMAAKAKEKS